MANITIDNLPLAVGLDGTEFVPIAKNTGFGYVTEKVPANQIADVQTNGQYVVVGTPPFLPNARILTGTAGQITLTDSGAGGNITLALASTAVVAGPYGDGTHFVTLTVDAEGRITNAASVNLLTALTSVIGALPTSLPASAGVLWLNGGVVSLS